MASNSTDEEGMCMTPYEKFCNGKRDFSEKEWLQIVKQNVHSIQYIENPSETLQIVAVQQFWGALACLKNPSKKTQLEAMKQNGFAIQFVKNPSEEVQLAAVKQNGNAIGYIKNPSEKVQLEVVKTINAGNYLPSNVISKKAIKKWNQIKQIKKACL